LEKKVFFSLGLKERRKNKSEKGEIITNIVVMSF